MIDHEYLDSQTQGNVLTLRKICKSNDYKDFLKHYELGRITVSMGFLEKLLNYINILPKLIKCLNVCAEVLDNEILILYTKDDDLYISLYFNFYSIAVEHKKEYIKKRLDSYELNFDDLNVDMDDILVVDDICIIRDYFEV